MVTAYEANFILPGTFSFEQVQAAIDKYTSLIEKQGGEVDDIDRWQHRKLAYEIKGNREGTYVLINFRSQPACKDELDRIFHISDEVIRYMIIKQAPKADRFPSKGALAGGGKVYAPRMSRTERESAPVVAEPAEEVAAEEAETAGGDDTEA